MQVHTLDVQIQPVNIEPEVLNLSGQQRNCSECFKWTLIRFQIPDFQCAPDFWTPLYVIKCSGVKSKVMLGLLNIWECTVPYTVILFLDKQNSPDFPFDINLSIIVLLK